MHDTEWTQRLATQQLEFLEVLENVTDVILITDCAGQIHFATGYAARVLGNGCVSSILGRNICELALPNHRAVLSSALERMQPLVPGEPQEVCFPRMDGEVVTLELKMVRQIDFDERRSMLFVAQDVTQQKELQRRLQLADRLASLGTLAAGVAHEINNPLAYVSGSLDFVADSVDELVDAYDAGLHDEVRGALADARDGARRIRDIVRDLKTFSRFEREGAAEGAVDLHSVARWAVKITAAHLKHRCSVRLDLEPVPRVQGDESKFGQVFVNLLMNAADAMPEGAASRNEVAIRTRVDVDGCVVVEVSDTGCGIPADRLNRIFEPFYTTKGVGKGTGLGLSITHGIITAAGGTIDVKSVVGSGTCFVVKLPPARTGNVGLEAGPPPRSEEGARRLRILVVDDEPAITRSVERALRRHEIIAAPGGRAAMALACGDSSFDAVLCDLMMPDVSGMEFFRALQSTRPELVRRVAFLTGGACTPEAAAFLEAVSAPKLTKPFDSRELERVLLQIAGGESSVCS